MSLPELRLSGSPYEQGVQHGEQLKERIGHNLAVYMDRFEREGKVSRAEVLRRARTYFSAIAAQNSDYAAGIRGIAAGSGYDLEELSALNVRYEILYYQFGQNALTMAEPDGCTSFAALPEATSNGHLLLGQNWDWIPRVQGAILRTVEPDGLETLSYTQAGIFGGQIGLNSAGLGLAINGVTTTDDDWSRLRKPFHVRCFEILRSHTFQAAVGVVVDAERSCSTNFLIAQTPDSVLDVEAAPDTLSVLTARGGCLVHTNHFLDPAATGVVEPPSERRPHSYFRLDRLTALMADHRPLDVPTMQRLLRDHSNAPYSVCRHEDLEEPPEERYRTVTSVVMDLHAGTLWLTDGPPCQAEYRELRLGAEVASALPA